MSCEGQADYYAGSVCFKRLIAISSSRDEITEAGPVLKSKCQNLAGKKGKDYDDCVRGANGGQGFLNLVMDFPISCELEDQEIASDLIRDSYPGRQCRLDTIVNASLCSEKLPLSMHPSDDTKNSCKASFAKRPACWFPAH